MRTCWLNTVSALVCAATIAHAQSTGTATIVGTVTDTSGALIPAAKVTARNTDTSFLYESTTSPEGAYYLPNLRSGNYELRVEATGFKAAVRSGILLRINESPRFDIQLEVGNVSESIKVEGTPPLLETETAGSGQVLDGEVVEKLPVMQKFVHRVLLYMPGMTNINGQHAVGQRQRAIGYSMDGVGGKEPAVGQVGDYQRTMIASLDSIQEFKMWTTGTPAEFGHSAGGQLSLVFKGGGNQFHGSIEDRYTNGKLIHRAFLEQLPRTGAFTYHEWGATASGPIIKNKTFWFAGFQQHFEKVSETVVVTVPSPEMYAGNFSFGGRGLPIYNPFTTAQNGTTWTRQPFANNQIPASLFDTVSKNVLALKPWREQSDPGTMQATGPVNNLTYNAGGAYNFQRYDAKIDHSFSINHKIFGRYSQVRHRSEERPVRELNELTFGSVYVKPLDQRNVVISDTYTFNPTMISEARLGFNRRTFSAVPETFGAGWASKLGIPGVSAETFPAFQNSGGALFYGFGPGGRSRDIAEDFTFQENLTKVAGKHTLKFGYEVIRTRYNSLTQTLPSGQYRMGGTELPFTPNTGNAFASFLLGTVGQAVFQQNQATWLPRWWSHAFYGQTTWRPRRNLTLELGLRWSYESPFSTKYGQQSQFDPNATDPLSGMRGALVHGAGLLSKRDLNNFQPRFGLAWNLRPRVVFRSSFGTYSVDLFTNGAGQNFEEYVATANVQALPGDPRHAFLLSQGPGAIRFNTAADGSVPFQGTNYGGRGASWYDPNMRLPYVAMWSAGFQVQLSGSWLMDAQYQGSSGVGLLNNWDMNAVPLNISTDTGVLNQVFAATQNYKPYRQFGSIQHYSNYGHNSHHSGTLRFERRYAQGMTLNAFYQLGKTLNDGDDDGGRSGITFYNRSLEKARAIYDIRHRFVSVFTYELPFGKGRKMMNGGGITNYFLGNWDFAWTQTFQSGPPVTITAAGGPRYLPGQVRPVALLPAEQMLSNKSGYEVGNRFPLAAQNNYFNNAAFGYAPQFTAAGMIGRNILESPGMRWTQLSLSKVIPIKERFRFSIRWDVNNPTKQPQLGDPGGVYNVNSLAQFGRFNGIGRGSFSDIGTARMHHIIVGRFEW
ncbi:MAG: TonB-dependent receptor [Bryobacterales bacterium]|nr:TonB-dependent receptor [Bryobacterales bacterium]